MSVHYPLAVTRALRLVPGGADRAAGRLAIGAGTAGILAPVLLGAVAAFAVLRSANPPTPVASAKG